MQDCPSDALLSLDDRIAIVLRLLPHVRSLSPADLRTLAAHLRVLSNVAEAWAQRSDTK